VRANPVALRGQSTLMPSAYLLKVIGANDAGVDWNGATADDLVAALDEVAQACWTMPSPDDFVVGFFLDDFALAEASGMLHFRMDADFLAVLQQLRHQLRTGWNGPPIGQR
jgi:hypothetical protein